MDKKIQYRRHDHAWLVIFSGEPSGWIVRELGGYAFLPRGFHRPSHRAVSLEAVQEHLEKQLLAHC